MLASWIRQVDILKFNFPSFNSTCDNLGLDSPRPPTSRVGKVGREGCDRRVLVDGPHPLALWPPARAGRSHPCQSATPPEPDLLPLAGSTSTAAFPF